MNVFKIIVKVFSISVLCVVIVLSFLVVYILGYKKGSADTENSFIDLIPELTRTIRDRYTPTLVIPTETPVAVANPTAKPKVTWGGPELWDVVNKSRVEHGVNPLKQADEICTIASIRLNELLELGKLDGHEGFANFPERRPDLKWVFEKYSMSEFLAYGGQTPEETVNLWLNTLAHKKLLTGGEYSVGCVYAQDTFAVAIAAF